MMFGADLFLKPKTIVPWAWWVEGADSSVDTEPKVPLLPAAGAGYSVNPDGPMPCHQRAEGAACRVNPATMVPLPLAATLASGHNAKPPTVGSGWGLTKRQLGRCEKEPVCSSISHGPERRVNGVVR